MDLSLDANNFDPNDSGSDFADDLPAITQSNSPQRRLAGEDALAEAEKRACELYLAARVQPQFAFSSLRICLVFEFCIVLP